MSTLGLERRIQRLESRVITKAQPRSFPIESINPTTKRFVHGADETGYQE